MDLKVKDLIKLLLEYELDSEVVVQKNSMQYFLKAKDIKLDSEIKDRVVIEI